MKCPRCGTDNEAGFRFCVKCGVNLDDPQDINIEQVDMGGYHSEEDPASGGFTFGSGTFTINDTFSRDSSSDLYTADELNDSDEEFDFSSFDEPFIPKLDTGRVTLPEQSQAVRQAQMINQGMPRPQPRHGMMNAMPPQGMMGAVPPQGGMQGLPPQQGMMGAVPPQGGMQGLPPQQGMMGAVPPQGGMQGIPPQNGSAQMNGMPVYGQPMMYGQPPVIGYDPSGMPIYGQPMMYGQPQAPDKPEGPAMAGMPGAPAGQFTQRKPVPPPPAEDKEKVEVPDDFWEFFDGGKATEHAETDPTDDFFGKRNEDLGSLKRPEKKKVSYMNDTPLVDASKLRKNEESKYNKMFMRSADVADSSALEAKKEQRRFDYMGSTKTVDASELRAKEERKSWNVMSSAGMADPNELQAANNTKQRKGSLMAQADRAVQAMPKKAKTYNDEIDAIELPEEMKAKKTNKSEIPGMPEF